MSALILPIADRPLAAPGRIALLIYTAVFGAGFAAAQMLLAMLG
jgi:hypothetical protein